MAGEIDAVKALCQHCVSDYDAFMALMQESNGNSAQREEEKAKLSSPSCLLFPEEHQEVQLDMMGTIAPALKINLRAAAKEWREKMRDLHGDRLWWGQFQEEGDTGAIPQEDGAVINLDCAHEQCNLKGETALGMPLYVYKEEVYEGISNIQIMASTSCALSDDKFRCLHHGEVIKKYLTVMYPRIKVSFDVIPSTAQRYSRMIFAGQLLGPPAVSSILPALVRSRSTIIVESLELYPWLSRAYAKQANGELVKGESSRVYYDLSHLRLRSTIQHLHSSSESSVMDVAAVPILATSSPSIDDFLWSTPYNPAQCRQLRGKLGSWVQDLLYAKKYGQYVTPLDGYAGRADRDFVPTQTQLYRSPTTYKWLETVYPDCKLYILTLTGLCKTMRTLDMHRIMFVGDSLSLHFSESFFKLLGFGDTPATDESLFWHKTITCPIFENNPESKFEIVFTRNDELNGETAPTSYGKFNCNDGYCHPWLETYASNPARTLLVANSGSHIHELSEFQQNFVAFLKMVDDTHRPQDIVFFRTTVPGHRDCLLEDIKPYSDYTEYSETSTKLWDWHKIPYYNDYAAYTLDRRKHEGNAELQISRARIELLDVMPMTVLRPDGHASGKDCNGCGIRKGKLGDCLHYSLPGPMDWWSHLLYSNLRDIATEEEKVLDI
mmetsp:Transcript_53677/g.79762  ORF Transcript_53677/g.79762 Transcript_53677/m.79762 type:complete len:664 (+) Transcript_53677:185-2176(+)